MEHKDNNKILVGKMKQIADGMAKHYTVKIGILAENNQQVSENMDLAAIGCVQEYGAEIPVTDKLRNYFRWQFGVNLKKSTTHIKIPARSWLYEPIKDANFKKTIYDYIGDEKVLEEYADKEIIQNLAKIIGEVGLLQIQKAFQDGGINGEWANNSPITIEQKGSSRPLIDKGDLRRQITYSVEAN